MRTLAKIAVVLLFITSAFAQRTPFSTAASHSTVTRYRDQLNFMRTVDSASQRRWYWEDTSCGTPFLNPMDRSAIFTNINDFSPVGLFWTLSGKHRVVPTFEVVGFDVKPGTQLLNPDARYGSISAPRIWSRARRAMMATLHY
jgi:hypothetical protein